MQAKAKQNHGIVAGYNYFLKRLKTGEKILIRGYNSNLNPQTEAV